MGKMSKLLLSVVDNPKSVRFADACKAAEALSFVHKGGSGAHRAFARPGEPVLLNFQNRDGSIPVYQARQLIAMIEEYGDDR